MGELVNAIKHPDNAEPWVTEYLRRRPEVDQPLRAILVANDRIATEMAEAVRRRDEATDVSTQAVNRMLQATAVPESDN